MDFSTIGFVGLGLIGGSIAKAIKIYFPDTYIMAYMRNQDTLGEALREGAIDRACSCVGNDFAECDLIFLCAPVATNAAYLDVLKPVIKPGCILTDVGSTKTDIHEKVDEKGLSASFIGGHPMAGSEKTGYANSYARLIENAYHIITPGTGVPDGAVDSFFRLVESLKALPLVIDYRRHDFVTACISHLPHLVASSLVELVSRLDDEEGMMKRLAAGGFKDITRIASSSPDMWEQICLTNSDNIIKVLDYYTGRLDNLKALIASHDSEGLQNFFINARDYRNSIPDSMSGPLKPAYALYCEMADEAGGIASLTTILADAGLSIKNIGIIHNREYEEAVFNVEFYDKDAYDEAIKLLRANGYTVYERV